MATALVGTVPRRSQSGLDHCDGPRKAVVFTWGRAYGADMADQADQAATAAQSGPNTTAAQGPQLFTCTTFDPPPGYRIERSIGLCWGILVRSVGFAKGFTGSFRALKAGEVPQYTEVVDQARTEAVQRMMSHAAQLGANAVLAVRFDSSDVAENLAEILAYGTAVVVVPDTPA